MSEISDADLAERDAVVVHQTSPVYNTLVDDVWFPANHNQVRNLLGHLLTQLDAMDLSDRAHKAARTLLVQEVWRWWGSVADNAVTSTEGCLAPVVVLNGGRYVEGEPQSNRWGWESESAWLSQRGAGAA